jgi:hypothetical protein
MRRTMVISGIAVVLFSILIGLLATKFGPFLDFVLIVGPVITGLIAILFLALTFTALLILFGTLRNWFGEAAGWFELIIFWIIIVVIAYVGFDWLHALLTGLLCIGVIYYIHIAQD